MARNRSNTPPSPGNSLWQLAGRHRLAGAARCLLHVGAEQPSRGAAAQRQLGMAATLRVILAVAPGFVDGKDAHGCGALHLAAAEGCAPAVAQLLSALPDPAQACAANKLGHTPLHLAASRGHTDCARLLLAAAPQAALVPDACSGWLPLHWAVWGGHLGAVQALLEAAPGSASARDRLRRSPLHLAIALHRSWPHMARALLAASPLPAVLTSLLAAGAAALPLFADLAMLRPEFGMDEWRRVPAPCPGLGRALPAVLDRSHDQAAQLVAHLLPEDRLRLRTYALCLARVQRRRRVYLPQHIVERLLGLFDA